MSPLLLSPKKPTLAVLENASGVEQPFEPGIGSEARRAEDRRNPLRIRETRWAAAGQHAGADQDRAIAGVVNPLFQHVANGLAGGNVAAGGRRECGRARRATASGSVL